jgi:dienelactone hydrolase
MKNKPVLAVWLRARRWLTVTLAGLLIGAVCLSAVHAESGKLTLPSGLELAYDRYQVEDNFLWLESKDGKIRLQKIQLSPEDQKRFFGSVTAPPREEPAPATSAPKTTNYRAVAPARKNPAAPAAPAQKEPVARESATTVTATVEKPAATLTVTTATASFKPGDNQNAPPWPTVTDLADYPEFSDRPESDLPSPDARPVVQTGSFSLPTGDDRKLTVEVCYRIPMDGEAPAKTAHNLIFYCPFPTENNKITLPHQLYLTDVLGCGMFTFTFTFAGKLQELGDAKTCYWSPESAWIPAVLAARDRICEMFKLEKRPLILTGESAGSNMAQTLAITYPDQTAAVAIIGGSEYLTVSVPSPVKWLIMNGRGDSTTDSNRRLAGQLKSVGAEAVFVTPAPIHQRRDDTNSMYHHVPGPQSRELINGFIWGILQERQRPDQGWPYAVPADPGKKFNITDAKSMAGLPAARRILLPSAAFAETWARVTLPVQKVNLKSGEKPAPVFLAYPARPVPKGVIIYYDTLSFMNYVEDYEDIASLAELGYLVIAPAGFGRKLPPPEEYLPLAQTWLSSQPVLRGRPLHLIAKGPQAVNFLATAARDELLNVKTFALLNYALPNYEVKTQQAVQQLAKQCAYCLVATQLTADDRLNKSAERLADFLVNRSMEKSGSKKLAVTAASSAQGKFILEYYEMLEKSN